MSRVWPRPVSSAPSDALLFDGVGALSKSFIIPCSYVSIAFFIAYICGPIPIDELIESIVYPP
jgi:hypothetical protein